MQKDHENLTSPNLHKSDLPKALTEQEEARMISEEELLRRRIDTAIDPPRLKETNLNYHEESTGTVMSDNDNRTSSSSKETKVKLSDNISERMLEETMKDLRWILGHKTQENSVPYNSPSTYPVDRDTIISHPRSAGCWPRRMSVALRHLVEQSRSETQGIEGASRSGAAHVHP